MLLSVTQGRQHVTNFKLWLNGQEVLTFLSGSELLNFDTPDMLVDLCPYMQQGENVLEMEVDGSEASSAELFIDGFIMPIDIPDAYNSFSIPSYRNDDLLVKGLINIKFIEGLKIRLNPDKPVDDMLFDQTGVSLYPLNLLLRQYGIKKIQLSPITKDTPEVLDKQEQQAEAEGIQFPNGNLSYQLTFSEAMAVNQMKQSTNILIAMPYFEGVEVNYNQ